ncbi:hypothetical protein MUJ63_03545 [Lachnospiraceae bacterium NSJ-143]|nr:hypothetical protein [Lachnospiraceae bacterium NSJ-143]
MKYINENPEKGTYVTKNSIDCIAVSLAVLAVLYTAVLKYRYFVKYALPNKMLFGFIKRHN